MEYRTLNNGIKMPALGFGVFQVADTTGADLFEILPEDDHYPTTYAELTDVAKQNKMKMPALPMRGKYRIYPNTVQFLSAHRYGGVTGR